VVLVVVELVALAVQVILLVNHLLAVTAHPLWRIKVLLVEQGKAPQIMLLVVGAVLVGLVQMVGLL
jgi:hypothetical protein